MTTLKETWRKGKYVSLSFKNIMSGIQKKQGAMVTKRRDRMHHGLELPNK